MKPIWRITGLAFGAVATVGFVVHASRSLRGHDLSAFTTPTAIIGVAIAAVLCAMIVPFSALAWRLLLNDLGARKSWMELAVIMGLTQLAKYLPGNVGHHIGRAGMAVRRGIPLPAFLVSLGVESALAVLAASAAGVAAALGSRSALGIIESESVRAAAIVALPAALGMGAVLLAGRSLPSLLARLPSLRSLQSVSWSVPGRRALACAFATYCGNYVIAGTALAAMTSMLLPAAPVDPALLTAAFALSWAAGFFTPGAPAGLGVREGVMLLILSTGHSQSDALLITIAARLATMAGDALVFLASAVLKTTERRRPDEPEATQPDLSNHEPRSHR